MKTKSRMLALMLAAVMVFSTAFVPAGAAKVNVKKVTVTSSLSGSKKQVIVAKGKSVKLAATVNVTPNKKANKKVTYSVKNKKIATVSSKGVVKGVKTGTTTITVTSKKNKKKKAAITVKVVKGAVNKVTLNKKKASLNVGQTLKLKTTVKAAKGAVKTIAYVSSNPKVAKVSKKGVITAVKSGSAQITARAIDGSGKKAVCKVTVSNPINLAGMDIPNARTVSFSLDKAFALTPEQVSLAKKIYVSGTFNRRLTINNLTTADNVNYTAVLSNDDSISVGDFVQVAVPSLTGSVKSLEMEYKDQICAFTDEEVSKWTVGEYGSDSFSFDYERGYSTYSLNGVPAGLSYKMDGDSVVVKGTPTTAGASDFVLSATDELGNTMSKTIHFIIGSDTVIAGASTTRHALIGTNAVTDSCRLSSYFTGGTGSYTYEVIAGKEVLDTSYSNTTSYLYLKASVAGTYTVTVRATDTQSRTCDINLVWDVKQGISIGGCLKDAQSNPMSKGSISFTNKNRAALYCSSAYASINSETSVYSALLEPGVYDIRASYSGGACEAAQSTTYLYNQSLAATQSGYDIQFPDLYKVVLTGIDQDSYPYWSMNHEGVGSGTTLYLKPGNYAIEANGSSETTPVTTGDWWNGTTTTYTTISYKLTSTFAIANTAVQAAVTKAADGTPSTSTTRRAGAKDTTFTAYSNISYNLTSTWGYDENDNYVNYYAYRFSPTTDGDYVFSDTTTSGIKIYNQDGTALTKNTDGSYTLGAGTTYIIGNGGNGGIFTITMKPTGSGEATPAE